jgi:hypothetical protein
MQVEMLKGLTTRLASTAADMEKEIVDNRQQKQEAMDYRVTKAQEVTEIEKVYLSVQSTFIACLQTLLFVLLWSFSPSKYVHGCLALLSCDIPYEHTAAVPVTMSCLLLDGFCY